MLPENVTISNNYAGHGALTPTGSKLGKELSVPKHDTWNIHRRARLAPDFIERRFAQQSGICFWCPLPLSKEFAVDHVIPVAKGGTDAEANLVLAHRTCNSEKSAKLPWEMLSRGQWRECLGLLDKWSGGEFGRLMRAWHDLPNEVQTGEQYRFRRDLAPSHRITEKERFKRRQGRHGGRMYLAWRRTYLHKKITDPAVLVAHAIRQGGANLKIGGHFYAWDEVRALLREALANEEYGDDLVFYLRLEEPGGIEFVFARPGLLWIYERLLESKHYTDS